MVLLVRRWSILANDLLCFEATLLENFGLRGLILDLSDAVVETLRVEDSLRCFGELVAQQRLLLLLMGLAHLACVVDVWGCTPIKRSIVLVELVCRRDVRPVESSQVGPEVWVLAYASRNPKAFRDLNAGEVRAVLDSSHLLHRRFVQRINIVESLVRFCKLSCTWWFVAACFAILKSASIFNLLFCDVAFSPVESCNILSKLPRRRGNRPLPDVDFSWLRFYGHDLSNSAAS